MSTFLIISPFTFGSMSLGQQPLDLQADIDLIRGKTVRLSKPTLQHAFLLNVSKKI